LGKVRCARWWRQMMLLIAVRKCLYPVVARAVRNCEDGCSANATEWREWEVLVRVMLIAWL
jgi:hypothetical protein